MHTFLRSGSCMRQTSITSWLDGLISLSHQTDTYCSPPAPCLLFLTAVITQIRVSSFPGFLP